MTEDNTPKGPRDSGSEERPPRKGYNRRADIPPDLLDALNEGRVETRTLAEWLAIDMPTLLRTVAPEVGLGNYTGELGERADALADAKVTARQIGIGQALFDVLEDHPRRDEVFEALATHRSDMVRSWAAQVVRADDALSLEERLARTRRFATDESAAVREIAWDIVRPYVARNLDDGIEALGPWVHDDDPYVRRCAVEATRPRGVWTPHIPDLKREPERGLALLEPVRSDDSEYVRKAVGNWLNDASKDRPEWVEAVCERWIEESPTAETEWIVDHGLRTIRKENSG